jgi:hypothetical protein
VTLPAQIVRFKDSLVIEQSELGVALQERLGVLCERGRDHGRLDHALSLERQVQVALHGILGVDLDGLHHPLREQHVSRGCHVGVPVHARSEDADHDRDVKVSEPAELRHRFRGHIVEGAGGGVHEPGVNECARGVV